MSKRQPKPPLPEDTTLMSDQEVADMLRISRSTFRRRVADGTFPQPVRVGPFLKKWMRGDILAYLQEHRG